MNDKLKQTMKILRGTKIVTDDRGRTVWADPVESANLELMSTQMLQQIIEKGDDDTKDDLREVAEGKDGILSRDTENGKFEVISDEELQQVLDGTDMDSEAENAAGRVEEPAAEVVTDEEELELVTTQMLRVVLGTEDEEQIAAEEPADSGFNPYDHG